MEKTKTKKVFLWICVIVIIFMAVDGMGTMAHEIYHYVIGEPYRCQIGIYIDRAFLGGGELVYDEGCYKDGHKFWSISCEDKGGNKVIPHEIEERNAQIIGWSTRILSLLFFIFIFKKWRKNN